MPQDRDIVREMWVHGDLKERLGIQHRRDMKRGAKSDIEQAPMFHRPHFRSESEISSFQPESENGTPPGGRSPMISDGTRSPPSIRTSPLATPAPPNEDDMVTPVARRQLASPEMEWRGSYYSASAIPAPSPIPGPGEPPMSSIAPHPVASYNQPSNTLQIPALRNRPPPLQQQHPPEAFEMSVRDQQPDDRPTPTSFSHGHEATEESYATAYDGYVDNDGGHFQQTSRARSGNLSPGHPPEDAYRDSVYSTYSTNSGPHVL